MQALFKGANIISLPPSLSAQAVIDLEKFLDMCVDLRPRRFVKPPCTPGVVPGVGCGRYVIWGVLACEAVGDIEDGHPYKDVVAPVRFDLTAVYRDALPIWTGDPAPEVAAVHHHEAVVRGPIGVLIASVDIELWVFVLKHRKAQSSGNTIGRGFVCCVCLNLLLGQRITSQEDTQLLDHNPS